MKVADIAGDMRLGVGQPVEEIAIGILVMMSFALTLVVWLGWLIPLPSLVAIGLFAALLVPATLWYAGWRARTEA